MQSIVQTSNFADSVLKYYQSRDFQRCLENLLPNYLNNQPEHKSFHQYTKILLGELYFIVGNYEKGLQFIQDFMISNELITFSEWQKQNMLPGGTDFKTYTCQKWETYTLICQEKYKEAALRLRTQYEQFPTDGGNHKKKNTGSSSSNDTQQAQFLELELQEITLMQCLCEILNTNQITPKAALDLYTLLSQDLFCSHTTFIQGTRNYRHGLAQWNLFNCTPSSRDPHVSPTRILHRFFSSLQNLVNRLNPSKIVSNPQKGNSEYSQNSFNDYSQSAAALGTKQQKQAGSSIESGGFSEVLPLQVFLHIISRNWEELLMMITQQNDIYRQQLKHPESKDGSSQRQKSRETSPNLNKNSKLKILNMNELVLLRSICYEQTQRYRSALLEYEKMRTTNGENELVNLNLSNCFILTGKIQDSKKLLQRDYSNNDYNICKMYNESMLKFHFEDDYEGALGLLSYIETQRQSQWKIFDKTLLPIEEITIYKAIAHSKCGDHEIALKTLEDFQISQNFSSIISIATLSYMIQEYRAFMNNKLSLLTTVDTMARLAKITSFQSDDLLQKFFQGYIQLKLQKQEQSLSVFKEIIHFFENQNPNEENSLQQVMLRQYNIYKYSQCCLYATTTSSTNSKLKLSINSSSSFSQVKDFQPEFEDQIVNEITTYLIEFDEGERLKENQNHQSLIKEQIIPALISVLLSSLFLTYEQQLQYYERVRELFFSKCQQVKQKQQSQLFNESLTMIQKSQNTNRKNDQDIFSFADANQAEQSQGFNDSLKQNQKMVDTTTTVFDDEEQTYFNYLNASNFGCGYYTTLLGFIQQSWQFFNEFLLFLENKKEAKSITFSKLNCESNIESDISLSFIFEKYQNYSHILVSLFYFDMINISLQDLSREITLDQLSQIRISSYLIKARVNSILSMFTTCQKLSILAVNIAYHRVKSANASNQSLNDIEYNNLQKFITQCSFIKDRDTLAQSVELLVMKDAIYIFQYLTANKISYQLSMTSSIKQIVDSLVSTRETTANQASISNAMITDRQKMSSQLNQDIVDPKQIFIIQATTGVNYEAVRLQQGQQDSNKKGHVSNNSNEEQKQMKYHQQQPQQKAQSSQDQPQKKKKKFCSCRIY